MLQSEDHRTPIWTARQLLWLTAVPGVGPVTALEVARAIPDPDEFESRWPETALSVGSKAKNIRAEQVHEYADFPDVPVIGYFDPAFPEQLRKIPGPPIAIWVRGTLRPEQRSIAVVGTRHPTSFGRRTATTAASHAVERSLGVVSGLALGVDAIAHEAALESGGYTIAVLGGALQNPQPSSNRILADRILEHGGALISESLPNEQPSAATLVGRNRLQSGLSVATVIAQSGIPGGTLHTARFTIEQGRKLIVPVPLEEHKDDPSCAGNVALTDPNGADPSVLKAKGPLAREIARRQPIADWSPTTPAELKAVIGAL